MKCPISGQPCDHAKPIYITQIHDNVKTEGFICKECTAASLPFGNELGIGSLLGSLSSLFDAIPTPKEPSSIPLPMADQLPADQFMDLFHQIAFGGGYPISPKFGGTNIVCTGCNMTLLGIRQAGRLGCPKCYESFREYLVPVLQRSHEGKLNHEGKAPKNAETFRHHNIENLKIKLADAVAAERFEDAVVLRDAIKRLEEDLSRQQGQNPNNSDS